MKFLLLSFLLISSLLAPPSLAQATSPLQKAVFAAGCFWCAEHDFEQLDGVLDVVSGYTGGSVENPTYQQVGSQKSGHYEAIEVTFDPEKISYAKLLNVFWDNHDPFDTEGQFCDQGASYRGAIFAVGDEQYQEASAYLEKQRAHYTRTIVTPVLKASTFYKAEAYHQDYAKKNPKKYKRYRFGCGRDQDLQDLHE